MLVNYVDKILSFSKYRTYSKDEAEELAQEIFLRAVKNISTVRDINKFEGWLWGVANNTLKSFRRERGREREIYSSEDIDAQIYYDEYNFEQDDVYEILRKNISQLSSYYRDILIMFYYDNLTSREIAERLKIPEGTVKYRLSIGRNKLKKEINIMQETALKPIKLNLYTNGSYAGLPRMYLNDALSHNILWQAYKEAKSVEDLSKLLGVPAYYIEDRIEMLEKCGTITKPTQNTILSDIIIYDESINKYDDIAAKECVNAISEKLLEKVKKLAAKTMELDIFTADKSHDELLCLFSIMAFDHFQKYESIEEYNKRIEYNDIPEKFDGGQWEFYAQTDDYKSVSFYNNRNWIKTEKHTFGHIVYIVNKSFDNPNAMRPNELKVCEKIIKGESINENEKEFAATAIKNGFIKKTGEKLELDVPFFNIVQYEKFRSSLVDIFDDIMPLYKQQVKKYSDGYKKLFPPHIKNRAGDGCTFQDLLRKVIIEWANTGKIKVPTDSVCNVLVEHDGGMFFSQCSK